ncbi:ABC transporter substrate-binding protein [Aeromicrobium chenweiae]|uniref:ABC transporter substrate-binding protein n=1 Tax=Aeromicrobium chenweiae TaxID=2079793 RepID=UPI00131ED863|nr:extracellular solute-binding protein [Aeromicrobium chenweiae]
MEITFSHWALTAPPFGTFTKIMDDFNASQSKYVIKAINAPYEGYHDTIFTQIGAGKGPTIAGVEESEFGRAVEAGLTTDLTDKVDVPSDGLVAYDKTLFDGDKRMGVVFTASPYQMLVNRPALDKLGLKVPTTYDEFLATAKAATKGKDNFGFAFRHTSSDTTGWFVDLTNWLYGSGGSWTDESGKPTLDSPEAVATVKRMKTFIDDKIIPVGADAPTYRRAFGEGKIPMVIEALPLAGIMAAQTPALAEGLEVHPLPFGSDQYLNIYHAAFVNKNASDEEKKGAEAFLSYMLTDDVQQKMLDTMGGALGATDAPFSSATDTSSPWLKDFSQTAGAVNETPVGAESEFAAFRQILLDQVEKIFAGQVSAEDGLAEAQKQAVELLDK